MSVFVILDCVGCGARTDARRVETLSEARLKETGWSVGEVKGLVADFCRGCTALRTPGSDWKAFWDLLTVERQGVYVANRLSRSDIASVQMLREMDDAEIMEIRQMGRAGVARIRAAIAELDARVGVRLPLPPQMIEVAVTVTPDC